MGNSFDCCALPVELRAKAAAGDGVPGIGRSTSSTSCTSTAVGSDDAEARAAAEARAKLMDAWVHLSGPSGAAAPSLGGDEALHCLVRAEFLENRYTGLFQRADFGVARFSSRVAAPRPPSPAAGRRSSGGGLVGRLLGAGSDLVAGRATGAQREARRAAADGRRTPTLELEFFRGGASASGHLLFAGTPTLLAGHAQCLCTQTPSAGLGDFAAAGQEGPGVRDVAFPWALVLRPCGATSASAPSLDRPASVPPGTAIYDIFACPSPGAAFEAGWLELVGRLVTCSPLVSEPKGAGGGLHFAAHRPREEDCALHPSWLRELTPAHDGCGAAHFGRLLERREQVLSSRGGGWASETLPHTRWSLETSVVAPPQPPPSPAASFASVSTSSSSGGELVGGSSARASLTAALRRRGGRCASPEVPAPADPPSRPPSSPSGSAAGPRGVVGVAAGAPTTEARSREEEANEAEEASDALPAGTAAVAVALAIATLLALLAWDAATSAIWWSLAVLLGGTVARVARGASTAEGAATALVEARVQQHHPLAPPPVPRRRLPRVRKGVSAHELELVDY